mgnify:CR=1 FL=1
MENIETHPDFNLTNKSFEEEKNLNTNNGYWTMFLNIHKTISKNRCPVCEELLDQKGIRETKSSIDHFRPKSGEGTDPGYPFIDYKKSFFTLEDNSPRAITKEGIVDEKPLLIDLRKEDPLDFFELVFSDKFLPYPILELKRKKTILKSSSDYNRIKETIKLFGLGNCHKVVDNKNMTCRHILLNTHYNNFIDLASAIKMKKNFTPILDANPELIAYGFFRFLINEQFEIHN